MTKRKPFIPKGSLLTLNEDETFERYAGSELERLPPVSWDEMRALWLQLPISRPATTRRILHKAVRICHEKASPPPRRLIAALRTELSVRDPRSSPSKRALGPIFAGYLNQPRAISDHDSARICAALRPPSKARSRPKSEDSLRHAAQLYVRDLSLRDIGARLSLVGKQSTIHGYMKQQQFISEARDEITRLHGRLRRLGASLADFRSWRAQQKTNEKMQLVHRN